MTRRGLCLVIAAPPGAGKTSISRALLDSEADLTLSVSVTTRAMRPGEQDGVHYHFRDMAELEQRLRNRGQDSDAEIVNRMAAAREEITHWDEFDHVLINQEFAATVAAARAILHAARSTCARQPGMADFIKGLLSA